MCSVILDYETMLKLLVYVDWSRPSTSSPRLAACGPVQSNLPFGLDWTEPYPRLGPSGLGESLPHCRENIRDSSIIDNSKAYMSIEKYSQMV